MIRIAICDDEPAILGETARRASRLRPDCALESFGSGRELLGSGKRFDLVFLDIEMPGLDGWRRPGGSVSGPAGCTSCPPP